MDRSEGILDEIDAQKLKLQTMSLTEEELTIIAQCSSFLAGIGLVFGLMSGIGISFGSHNNLRAKFFGITSTTIMGPTLGAIYGIQKGFEKLVKLEGTLGSEIRRLETLEEKLRKNGPLPKGEFHGDAVELEKNRLNQIFGGRSKAPNRFTESQP